MASRFSIIVPLATVLAAPPAFAKEPVRLAASSKWVVDYADDSCRLARKFGDGDATITLIFDRFSPGDRFRLTLRGKPVKTNVPPGMLAIRFGPAESEQKVGYFPGSAGNDMPAILVRDQMVIGALPETVKDSDADFSPIESIGIEREAAATFVELGRPLRQSVVLETGSLGNPFAALRKCTDELLAHWGIDLARYATLTRPAIPKRNPVRWLKSSDYPSDMIAEGKQAIIQFRLSIDETGGVAACHIQQSTRLKAFDDAVCKGLTRRAEFTPALDGEGKPMPAYYLNTVIFQL